MRVLDFGKCKGKVIADCPESYVLWLSRHEKVLALRNRWAARDAKFFLEKKEEKAMDDSFEEQVRRHDELMARIAAEKAAEQSVLDERYTEALENPPVLSGSEKQVAWAFKLRRAYIEFYSDRRRTWCAQQVIEHTDAKHWIDNRYGLGVTNSDQRAIQSMAYAK